MEYIRYSIIEEKNPREIVMLRGSGCKWKKCSFCDYHMDYSEHEEDNYQLNRQVLSHVTGCFRKLEVINSGSFCDLDENTLHLIIEICIAKDIQEISFECHWMHRGEIAAFRQRFLQKGIQPKIKIGVETFDVDFREHILHKGMPLATPSDIASYADVICLLFGLTGQTLESMENDIATGLQYFERICINIMNENTTAVHPDPAVIRIFYDNLYTKYINNPRVDILMENTDFGVGGDSDE